jgi:hypothetical protein
MKLSGLALLRDFKRVSELKKKNEASKLTREAANSSAAQTTSYNASPSPPPAPS